MFALGVFVVGFAAGTMFHGPVVGVLLGLAAVVHAAALVGALGGGR